MDNQTNINIKENSSNNGTLLKHSKNNYLNIESNNQKYDFAFNILKLIYIKNIIYIIS
jgi:hypothetical protein